MSSAADSLVAPGFGPLIKPDLVNSPQRPASKTTSDAKSNTNNSTDSKYPKAGTEALQAHNVHWVVVIWFIGLHMGALLAPFFFSWTAVLCAVALHWLTLSIGICFGYHRLLSHRSMKAAWPVRFFTLMCGSMAGQSSPLDWASNHRLHHARSDKEGDPHSPNDGKWWSHILWLLPAIPTKDRWERYHKYTPDLVKDPLLVFFEYTHYFFMLGVMIPLYMIAGWPGIIWGMAVRLTIVYQSTWLVNSATHIWGYRSYETRDLSKNNWWVSLLVYGEGWHNNHHAHPSLARAGYRWWEVDMTWWAIRTLQMVGLVWDVKDDKPLPKTQEQAVPAVATAAA